MKIDEKSWHCRLYLWWYEKKYGYPNENGFSNLCPYMRAVMFWAPTRILFWDWVKIGKVPLFAFTVPLAIYAIPETLGYASYTLKMVLWRLCLIFVVVGAGLFLLSGIMYLFSPSGADITKPLRNRLKKTSFPKLIHSYFRSAHDRVCPEIGWK